MNVSEHIEALQLAGSRFVDILAEADLDAPVPPCPGWVVRDLARHLGGIHRWATAYVSTARTSVIEEDLEEVVGGWPDDAALTAWFAEGHADLVGALVDAPEDLACFTFLEAPSPLAMWARRQAHETSIHRVDIESSTDCVTGFPPAFAADGIDELLTVFITRRGRGPRAPQPTSVAIHPVDVPDRWLVRFDAVSCVTDRKSVHADVTVSGSASDLYLWVWNRPGAVVVDGDQSVVDTWRETVHVRWS